MKTASYIYIARRAPGDVRTFASAKLKCDVYTRTKEHHLLLDMLGGPNHAGPKECEGFIKCGSDAMLLADAENQVVYPQVFYYYVGHIR